MSSIAGATARTCFVKRPTSRPLLQALGELKKRYHKLHRSGGHVWQGRFKSPVIQDDDHLLTVLRYIEANPLRAKRVEHAEDYRRSSYRAHGRGEADELLDRLALYEQLSPYAAVRQRLWAKKVHLPLEEHTLAAVRRSSATGLPYGDDRWVQSLAKKLDLAIRPRGRPRKAETDK